VVQSLPSKKKKRKRRVSKVDVLSPIHVRHLRATEKILKQPHLFLSLKNGRLLSLRLRDIQEVQMQARYLRGLPQDRLAKAQEGVRENSRFRFTC
jgi:hypothetical protein